MVKIIILLIVLSLKIVSIQSEQFGLFPGILGEPRRLSWHPFFEPQLNHMMQINEQMLTTATYVQNTYFHETLNFQFFIYFASYTLPPEMFGAFESVWCKMALGEVGVSLL